LLGGYTTATDSILIARAVIRRQVIPKRIDVW
jgi:hypothetical protein